MPELNDYRYCWTFEARSIQDFIFSSGRLADAVGASLVVAGLTGELAESADRQANDLLTFVMRATGAEGSIRFSRRGGGAFIAFFATPDQRRRTRALWHLAIQANAPGLRWSDGLSDNPTPQHAAQEALAQGITRSQLELPALPETTAAHARSPRTGSAAVASRYLATGGRELLDAAVATCRRHRQESGTLLNRFSAEVSVEWPTVLKADETTGSDVHRYFPLLPGSSDVAFLHADGNGLGVLLRRLAHGVTQQDYVERYAQFSQAISEATVEAARHATATVLTPKRSDAGVMPARPLILGGDDLLIIVRADLALAFAQEFLAAFEKATAVRLRPLCGLLKLQAGEGLTAACGILVTKATFPFAAAAHLAEALCARAKAAIKTEAAERRASLPMSAVALARSTASLQEVEIESAADGRPLGLPAYVLGRSKTMVALEALIDLGHALAAQEWPQGPARRLLHDLHVDQRAARERWARMREVMQRSAPLAWTTFEQALVGMGISPEADLPFCREASPWADALLVRDLLKLGAPSMEMGT